MKYLRRCPLSEEGGICIRKETSCNIHDVLEMRKRVEIILVMIYFVVLSKFLSFYISTISYYTDFHVFNFRYILRSHTEVTNGGARGEKSKIKGESILEKIKKK